MEVCSSGHEPIAYDDTRLSICPLCEVLALLSEAIENRNKLEQQVHVLEAIINEHEGCINQGWRKVSKRVRRH